VVPLQLSQDERGDFVKLYRQSLFEAAGLEPEVAEVFVSRSTLGAVRGLHFQVPPHSHAKTVVCLDGRVFDVVVDLRVGSPTFREHAAFELEAAAPRAVHVPAGCAHGFQALSDCALLAYIVSTEHSPEHDAGVRWDTVGVTWPLADPVLSSRDRSFPASGDFESPFRYRPSRP
jgi:dTDP-4-dehydrorhamnose 3,5-epimerase